MRERKGNLLWLKSVLGHLLLYGAVLGIFTLVLYLYGTLEEAVFYAAGLAFVLLALVFFVHLAILWGRRRKAIQALAVLPNEFGEFPGPATGLERMYQEKLKELFDLIGRMDDEERIGRREMMDYYGLWAHQIKTPLAAMRVLVQSLEESSPADGDAQDVLRDMKMELFKTEQYVAMVLSYLRAEEMGHDLLLKEYPLDGIIRQAVKKYSSMFISKKIRLEYKTCEGFVVTDEKWLLFVLEQLLSNALKYTPCGGTILIYREGEGKGRLVIEDDGIGIQTEDLPRIFEKGFTGFNGRQDKKSTGIGLYLCKMICDKLGHGLAVESGEGTGTRAYVGLER